MTEKTQIVLNKALLLKQWEDAIKTRADAIEGQVAENNDELFEKMISDETFPATVVGDEQMKLQYIKTAAYYWHLKHSKLNDIECWLEGEKQINKKFIFCSYQTPSQELRFVSKNVGNAVKRFISHVAPTELINEDDNWKPVICAAPKLPTGFLQSL